MKRQNERIRDLKKRLERITTLYVKRLDKKAAPKGFNGGKVSVYNYHVETLLHGFHYRG